MATASGGERWSGFGVEDGEEFSEDFVCSVLDVGQGRGDIGEGGVCGAAGFEAALVIVVVEVDVTEDLGLVIWRIGTPGALRTRVVRRRGAGEMSVDDRGHRLRSERRPADGGKSPSGRSG